MEPCKMSGTPGGIFIQMVPSCSPNVISSRQTPLPPAMKTKDKMPTMPRTQGANCGIDIGTQAVPTPAPSASNEAAQSTLAMPMLLTMPQPALQQLPAFPAHAHGMTYTPTPGCYYTCPYPSMTLPCENVNGCCSRTCTINQSAWPQPTLSLPQGAQLHSVNYQVQYMFGKEAPAPIQTATSDGLTQRNLPARAHNSFSDVRGQIPNTAASHPEIASTKKKALSKKSKSTKGKKQCSSNGSSETNASRDREDSSAASYMTNICKCMERIVTAAGEAAIKRVEADSKAKCKLEQSARCASATPRKCAEAKVEDQTASDRSNGINVLEDNSLEAMKAAWALLLKPDALEMPSKRTSANLKEQSLGAAPTRNSSERPSKIPSFRPSLAEIWNTWGSPPCLYSARAILSRVTSPKPREKPKSYSAELSRHECINPDRSSWLPITTLEPITNRPSECEKTIWESTWPSGTLETTTPHTEVMCNSFPDVPQQRTLKRSLAIQTDRIGLAPRSQFSSIPNSRTSRKQVSGCPARSVVPHKYSRGKPLKQMALERTGVKTKSISICTRAPLPNAKLVLKKGCCCNQMPAKERTAEKSNHLQAHHSQRLIMTPTEVLPSNDFVKTTQCGMDAVPTSSPKQDLDTSDTVNVQLKPIPSDQIRNSVSVKAPAAVPMTFTNAENHAESETSAVTEETVLDPQKVEAPITELNTVNNSTLDSEFDVEHIRDIIRLESKEHFLYKRSGS